METTWSAPDRISLYAMASIAFVVACVSHEVIGHGGVCLAVGGHITLLTSVYFRSINGGVLTDAAGPLANLIFGICCVVLARRHPQFSQARLFLVLAAVFNLLWGTGYFIFSAVTDTGDWALVLRGLSLQPIWLWRCLMGALGLILYIWSTRTATSLLPRGTPLVGPYLVAGVVSCSAVFFFAGPLLPALRAAAQESLGSGVGLLIVACRGRRLADVRPTQFRPASTVGWLVVSIVVLSLFFLLLGKGFGDAASHRSPVSQVRLCVDRIEVIHA